MYFLTAICCVCSESSKNLRNLNDKDNQQLKQKFQYCTYGIDDVEPSVPLCMCNNCLHNLNVAYEFKKSCATTIARLRSYVTQLVQCKLSTDADVVDKRTVPRGQIDRIVYSDLQVHITRCSPTFNLSFEKFEPIICVVESIKTEVDPVLDESLNISDENMLFETNSVVVAKESIENLSLCLSDIIRKEHSYAITDSENQLINNEVLADEENYLNHLVKKFSTMQVSPVNFTPTSARLQSTEELNVRRSKLKSSSNKSVRHAKSEKEFVDVGRGVAAAANVGDSPRGQRTPRPKRQVPLRRNTEIQEAKIKKLDLLYKCGMCSRRFSRPSYLRFHLLKHIPHERSYRCTECGIKFSSRNDLKKHRKVHSKNRKQELDVRRSEIKGSSNKSVRHAKTEIELLDVDRGVAAAANGGDSPHGRRTPQAKRQVSPCCSVEVQKASVKKLDLLYKCSMCKRRFSRLNYLQRHLQTHIPHEQSYRCTECGINFSNRNNLKKHSKIHSKNRKTYKCTFCPKQYNKSNSLKVHLTEAHQTQCSKCDKVFNSNQDLRLHRIKEHFKEFFFECEICGKVLTRLSTYRIHVRSHESGTPFQCSYCPEAFQNNSRLKQHMVLKHYIGKLACQNCGIRLEKSMFDEHMKTHESDSRHECPQCGKTYKREREFKVHVKRHDVENCYKCRHCGKTYLTLLAYKNHLLTHSET